MCARRRWLTLLMILGFVAAQAISVARACGGAADAPRSAPQAVADAAMPADCPMAGGAATDAACDAHCVPQGQADKGADVRVAALPLPSVLVTRVVQPEIPVSALTLPPRARITSPPLSLLFGRLLI